MKNNEIKTDDFFTINPFYYLKVLTYKAPIILLVTIICVVISVYFVNSYSTVIYKAVSKIIRYDKKISMPRDVPYKFQNFNYDTALQTIRTRKNLNEVIKILNLDTTVEKLFSSYEIRRRKNSDIIEIFFIHKDKDMAVKGADLLTEIFLKNFHEIQNAATNEIYNYYKLQKSNIEVEIEALETQKVAFNNKNKILSLDIQKDYKYEQLNEIALNLIDTKVLKNEYTTKIKEISEKLKNIPKEVQLEYSVRSADLKAIDEKEKELSKMKQKYTQHNPKIKTLKKQIEKMKDNYANNKNKKNIPDEITYGNNPLFIALVIELSQSKIGVVSSTNRIAELIQQQEFTQNEIKELNFLEKEYSIIYKQLKEKKQLMDLVVQRLNELKIVLDSTQEDFKFLERAKTPKFPESNYKKAIVIASASFSLFIMIGFFILKSFFDFKIKEPFDIRTRFNIKLLGEFTDTKDKKIIKKDSLNFINNFIKSTKNKKIVLVSSDLEKTGKTFVIDLLTYFSSNIKRKILFIQTVDKNSDEIKDSLIDYSNDNVLDLKNVNIVNEFVDKLYIINDEKNDYQLANDKATLKLFKELKNSSYEQVIFEIPSYDSNPYFFINLSSYADLILLVFKSNYSDRKKIDLLINEIKKLGLKHIQGVLNVIDKKFI
ncbi:MAG: GumC family protein [Poseidonibacter sp.]|uniref:GumC family protein n=1 Tax=Poseidonibacter sp. TaxID=2321188 RepID=UPI00359D7FE0